MKNIIYIMAICTGSFLLSGCKKFVEADLPETEQVTGNVFEEKYTATAAVTGIYGGMYSLLSLDVYTGLSSDEFTNYGYDLHESLYGNTLTEKNGALLFWSNAYNYIYQANAAVEGLQNSKGIVPEIRNQLLGEVKFIRAFWYYYLINLYGEVPLVTTTDHAVIVKLPKSSKAEVYNQIIKDLTEAQSLLGNDYVDSKNGVTSDRVRPTKWVAAALLARVYLFNKDFRNAELQSTAVIENNKTFRLADDLSGVFLKNSNEAIWQLLPPKDTYRTDEGAAFILTGMPTAVTISPQLLKAFEPDDLRFNEWIGSIVISDKTYYFPFKYKVREGSSELTEYSMVLRLAEQYLIRAEARVQQNNLLAGTDDLNVIRIRAGLKKTEAADRTELLDAILQERRVELFAEGHRWIDLKYSGKIDEVMSRVTPEKGGGKWESFQQLYPIPVDDVQRSSNLSQNSGY